MDVADDAAVRAAVARAEDIAGGALGCVVLNAAYAVMGAQEEADLAEVRTMFETNLFGASRVVQAAVPAMRAAGRGAVVFVSSIGARQPYPLLGHYQASKAALGMLAEALSIEMRPFGVRVAVLEPGVITGEFGRSTRPTGAAARGEGPYAALQPQVRAAIGRLRAEYPLHPEDVARVAARAALGLEEEDAFRLVVGEDAAAADEMRGIPDHTAYEDALVAFLGLDWPRGRRLPVPRGPLSAPPASGGGGLDLRGAED